MTFIGIVLRTPTASELTAASIMGTGLWVAAMGICRVAALPVDRVDAGAILLVILWGCISARMGIRIDQGHRHLAANLCVSAGLLALYQSACALAG